MVVTREVSKLSGWLNADARCRESKGGHTVWCEVQSTGSGRRWRANDAVQAACRRGLDCRLGAGHGEERTVNMLYMSVTLGVSKLSGWLNADALCRVERRAYDVGRGAEYRERPEVAGDRGVQGRARLQIGGRARGAAHVEHLVHGCDAGGVEAQRLVERRRVLPRVGRRAYDVVRGAEYRERPEVAGDRGASGVQGRARLQIGSRARGGAHPEHAVHGCDAGGVEAQRLVERRRVLPRVGRRAYDVGRGAEYREAGGGGRPRRHGEERTSNMLPMVVTLEVSKLSGWLNADALCRVERRGVRCGARCGPGAGGRGWWQRTSGMAVKAGGARACAERTLNIALMVVTLDVSQLERSSSKFFRSWKR
eukprot:scaffold77878_cov55-Phaeocystis_antarctica.AAC.2